MLSFIKSLKHLFDKYSEDEMTVYAAQASFFIIISAIPFIMVLLTLIQLIPSLGKSDLMSILVSLLPDALDSFVINIVEDLYTKSPTTILSITIIIALWSSSRGMLSIERGLNRVLNVTKRHNFIVDRLICVVYTIVFTVVTIMSLLLLIFGSSIQELISYRLPIFENAAAYIINIRSIIALAIFITFFTGIYSYLPGKKLGIKKQLPGAVFSTIGWMLFSYAFSVYFDNFSNFSYMYGSLTAIVLLMLWLYFCICILFLGAEINQLLSGDSISTSE